MIDASEVFNPADFESLKLWVFLSNYTTRTEVKDPTACSVIEVGEKSLTMEIPPASCNAQHSVMVAIQRAPSKSSPKPVPLFSATGKVKEAETLDDKRMKITVELVQFEEKSWKDFLSLFSDRQEEINRFLSAVRGY